MNVQIEINEIDALKQAFLAARAKKMRHRDAAQSIGLTEGQANALFVGEHVTRLQANATEIIQDVPLLGKVLALTRNESAVHEKMGEYQNLSFSGSMGLALGVIDLRMFQALLQSHVFAVEEESAIGIMKSLQFFDRHGNAVHKIFLLDTSDHEAYADLVRKWAELEQIPSLLAVEPPVPEKPELADEEIDVEGMRVDWAKLQDTHDFFGLLKKYRVSRTQILRLADPQFAYPVSVGSVRMILEKASATKLPIMVFVGNTGIIQIHTGPVDHIKVMGDWLNVLDPEFNLHLKENAIAQAWVVKKPTVDGIVTALEIFDQENNNIAMFFGERKPGVPELPAWRALIDTLN